MTASMIVASAVVGLLTWLLFLRYSRRNEHMFHKTVLYTLDTVEGGDCGWQ